MKMMKYVVAALLMCAPLMANADSLSDNKAKSKHFQSEIKILTQEIKTIKARQKLTPEDSSLAGEMVQKKAALAEVKNQKKIVDAAIKTEIASRKAAKAAEKAADKAKKNAEKAAAAAEKAAKQ